MRLVVNRHTIAGIILSTLDFDSARTHHTPDTMISVMKGLGIVECPREENALRILLADMLQCGALDMTQYGRLILPAEDPDPVVEGFRGDWFVTKDGQILGPMSEGEAKKHVSPTV